MTNNEINVIEKVNMQPFNTICIMCISAVCRRRCFPGKLEPRPEEKPFESEKSSYGNYLGNLCKI